MNKKIQNLIEKDFQKFIKLVELGVIDKEAACNNVIAINNAQYIYCFAENIKGANIKKLEDAIIATNNAEYICYFAWGIKGANIAKLEDAIIKTEDYYYIYLFANNVKGANIDRLYYVLSKINKFVLISHQLNKTKDILLKKLNQVSITVKEEINKKCDSNIDDYTYLIKLLDEKKYDEIKENKEKFANLFKEENQVKKLKKH